MANMTTTTGAVFIPEVWSLSIQEFLRSNLVLADLVQRFDSEVAKFGDTVHIQSDTELSANNKVAGVSVSPQNPTESQVNLSVNVHKESSFFVEDILAAQANVNLMENYTKNSAYAVAKAIDTSLAALATGFSTSKGTYNTAITTDVLLDAIEVLDLADVPMTDRHFVFQPDVKRDLLDISTYTSSDFVSGNPVESGKVAGMLYGVQTHMSTNILKTGSNTSNMLFHRDALALALQKGPRVQSEYKLEDLGWLVVVDAIYGVIEVRDNHGLEIKT